MIINILMGLRKNIIKMGLKLLSRKREIKIHRLLVEDILIMEIQVQD